MEAVTFGATAMSGTHASLQKCQIFGKQPGVSLQELKLVGLSQMQKNGCGRMAMPAKIKLLFPLKVEANVSGIGKKVNGTKVNGTKVEMGGKKNKSSLEEEEETTTTATAAGGRPKSSFSSTMPAGLRAYAQNRALQAVLAAMANVVLAAEKQRKLEEIAGKTEVPVDALRQGRLVEGKLVYRQTFVIRSYEVGADKTASVETLMNHFQVEPPPPLYHLSLFPMLFLPSGGLVVGIAQTASIRVCTKMICNPFLSSPDQSQINLC
jgi:hypothetical protein